MVETVLATLAGVLIGSVIVMIIANRHFDSYCKQKAEADEWEYHNEYDSHGGVWRVGTRKKK